MSTARCWRFAAHHTHLYPGARLDCLEADDGTRMRQGDGVLVEFADGSAASGCIRFAARDAAVLRLAAHTTTRGTPVASKAWQVVPGPSAGCLKVAGRA